MLLGDQHHGHGRVIVEQVEEMQPAEFHQFHRCAGHGVVAVVTFAPGDVLVAEHLTGAVAKPVAELIDQFD